MTPFPSVHVFIQCLRGASHSVYDLIPVLIPEDEQFVGDGQAEELPLSLSLHHPAGELGDPGRVGGRGEPQLTHYRERETETDGRRERERERGRDRDRERFHHGLQRICHGLYCIHRRMPTESGPLT